MTDSSPINVSADRLVSAAAEVFIAVGVPSTEAETVATSLVDADLEGVSSHGVMLLPMYIERIRRGSVSKAHRSEVVVDREGSTVIDAHHSLGQLSASFGMTMAVHKARTHGTGTTAVRHAFHFGMARRYSLQAAAAGCVGFAMCNTRPLMPAPGGAERLVGNNPLSIALPTAGEIPLVLDFAMSEAAMGKIRIAKEAGRTIPDSWATDADGVPTTDPASAIAGMLMPVAGPKGFGLAFMLDLLSGLLSGGAWGEQVQPLYGDASIPYDCSFLFLAIDISHFRPVEEFAAEAAEAAERVRNSRTTRHVDRLYAPGELGWQRRKSADGKVVLDSSVHTALVKCGQSVGVNVVSLLHEEE